PHQDQSPFNQNFVQQPMTNPKDITDPTTAMNMALALMAKAFKLNYSTPTNNNQRISSNPRNRQIAQPGMNMGQDRQMQMIEGNGGNQFRQYAGHNAGNLNGYNEVQNVGNQVAQNPRIQNVGNQNGLIGVQGNEIQNQIGNGNLVAVRAEGNAAGKNGNQSTRSSARNLFPPLDNPELTIRRRSRSDLALLNNSEMAAEGPGVLPVLDLRTMKELCHPSLYGRGGPIASIAIQAMNFGLNNDMIQQVQNSCQFHGLSGDDANKHLDKFLHVNQSIKVNGVTDGTLRLYLFPHSLTHHATAWFDRLPRNSINTFEQMAKMFLKKYFPPSPPSMVTKLRNEITNFCQRSDESLFEAWERYKLSIDRCPNHNMLPVTQIDTFYNGLTSRHRDTINAAGGTFMKRRPEECYDLIKNMTAHHNDWDTSVQRSESSSSITSSFDTEIAALKAEMEKINKNLMRVLQVNQQVKAVTPNCKTCGGPHSFSDCVSLKNLNKNVVGSKNVIGGKDCLPMLAPGNYVKWKSRIKRYIDTKPNHKLIHYCLKNPPYKFTWADKEVPISEGIDNDIYSTFDACPNACEMWKAIESLKQGESINVQDLETNLYWEFRKFTSHDEWQRFVTLVKLSQELKTVSYHKIYDTLKQHQNEVNEIRAEKIERVSNLLVLVAQQQPVYHPQNHPTHYNQNSSTRSQQVATRNRGKAIVNSPSPIYDQEPSMVAEDDETSKDKEIDKLMALISLSFKKIYKPTNNNLRTSSNTSRANQDNSPKVNREHADWRDDTDGELEDQELEAHYIEHPEQSESIHNTYLIEQDEHNVIIDLLDMSYDREHIDQNDVDNDLANERELLASLIEKLKCEINDNKNRNKFLETSNKVLIEQLKGEIKDFKNKNKSLKSSNNRFKEANNKLSETNKLLYNDFKKSQAELKRRNDVEYASKVEIDCAKPKGDLISYKIESQKSFNKYTQTINDLNQTISEMKKKLSAHQETISILSK
nr:reverse transcriptase domain-containing protein [Tanacetum cinerariifolium]